MNTNKADTANTPTDDKKSSDDEKLIPRLERYRWMTGSPVHTIADAATWYLSTYQANRRPENTVAAYRNALNVIAGIMSELEGISPRELAIEKVNRNLLADAFNEYSVTRAASSQRQTWSVWNGLCQFLVDHEVFEHNPMARVPSGKGRDKPDSPTPFSEEAVQKLLEWLAEPDQPEKGQRRRWKERDRAMILLLLTTGMRESELCALTLKDVAPMAGTNGARQISVKGKGNKPRKLPIKQSVVEAIEDYLETRTERFPESSGSNPDPWKRWPRNKPLFVDTRGEGIRRSTVYYRVKLAYKEAGLQDDETKGAVVHQLRHTFATFLANNPNVTVYELKNLLGHSSLSTTERYTSSAGDRGLAAASRNPVYAMMEDTQ